MIVPIAILMTSWGRKHVGLLVASACVVVGTFAMRSIIVLGGWMIPRGGTGLREYATPPGAIDWTEPLPN